MEPFVEALLLAFALLSGVYGVEWIVSRLQKIKSKPKPKGTHNNYKTRPSSDFAALIEAIRAEGGSNREEEQTEEKAKKLRENLTIVLLILTVVEMVKVYGPIRDQADAAKRTAENSRAWVGPLNATFSAEPTVGNAFDIAIFYNNSGHDPASGFIPFVSPFVSREDDATLSTKIENYIGECKRLAKWTGGSVVYPTSGGTLGGGGFQYFVKTVPNLVSDAVTKGTDVIIVQGCFGYRTADIERHSYFCYFYKQGSTKIQNLNICSSGHYAD